MPLHGHKAEEVAGGSVCPRVGVSMPGSDSGSTAGVAHMGGHWQVAHVSQNSDGGTSF